jgi:SNF2 family DNA or RNA helicase
LCFLIVDEVHRLKNWKSKIILAVRQNLKYHLALLLTGTLIQNSLEELWCLVNLASPNDFHEESRDQLLREHGQSSDRMDNLKVERLQTI